MYYSLTMKFLLSVALLIFSSCITVKNTVPDWVNSPHKNYPENRYLATVGEGTSRTAASDAAKAELLGFIRQQVTSSTSGAYTADTESENYRLVQSLNATSSFNAVVGVRIAETWSDQDIYYALAVLDKTQATMHYSEKITQYSEEIEKLRANAADDDDFDGFLSMRRAITLAEECRDCHDILSAVNPAAAKTTKVISPETLITEVNRYTKNLHITAVTDMPQDVGLIGRLETAIENSMNKFGLQLIFSQDKAVTTPYKMETILNIIPEKTEAGIMFARYELTSALIDVESGKVIFSFSQSEREAHINAVGLNNRILRSIEEGFATRFFAELGENP